MNATISLTSLWQMLKPLPLDNRKWLADKLQDSIRTEEITEYICKEEILQGISQGLKEMREEKGRPAEDLLKELRNGL